ncbi:MAG: hypothetical protein JWM68_1909 [Verrucomicrobiales bacterium]|nr:hypothetical protein [Verrucomicrobiales bacterium]
MHRGGGVPKRHLLFDFCVWNRFRKRNPAVADADLSSVTAFFEKVSMKTNLILLLIALVAPLCAIAQPSYATIDHQHTDLRILYNPGSSNLLSLVARDEENKINYDTNQVVLLVKESAKYILDADFPPFGNTGDPLWILPQSQDPTLLYLGYSAEGIGNGIFNGPLTIQLKAVDGPGHFFCWQANAFGDFNIKMNTRDGISTNDSTQPLIGSHEHFNWGFTTSGVYYVTFQVSGQRVGDTTNIYSPESTFVFHVLPMRPFEVWQETNWIFRMPRTIVRPNADPDGDGIMNIFEYGFGLDPKVALRTNLPVCTFIVTNSIQYGALQYVKATNATDLLLSAVATNALGLPNQWPNLTNTFSAASNSPATQLIIVRDSQPKNASPQRFYRLNAGFQP